MKTSLKKTLLAAAILGMVGCQTVPEEQRKAIEQIKEQQASTTDSSLHFDLAREYLKTAEKTDDIQYVYMAVEEMEIFSTKEPQHLEGLIARYQLYYDLAGRGDVIMANKLRMLFDKLPDEVIKNVNPPTLAKAVYKVRTEGFSDAYGLRRLLKKSIKEQPHSVTAHIMLAKLYAYDERYNLAVPLMAKVTEMQPENGKLAKLYADMLVDSVEKDCLYREQAPYKEALVQLRKSLKANPEDPKVHAEIARIYSNIGRTNLSLNAYKKYDKLKNDADSKADLVSAYVEAGKPDSARVLIEKQIAKNDVSPYFYEHSARFYFMEGEIEHASEMWNKMFESTDRFGFYDVLAYSYINEKLNGHDIAMAAFEPQSNRYRGKWQKHLRDYRLGEITKPELFLEASNACELTEANYAAALDAWLNGNDVLNQKHLQEVVDKKIYGFVEYIAAKHMLANN
ncbi:tetratricopeptide repeat protein [Neptuniibacter caesariensis]|uniref:Tetratricopeptide repeat protein n=1 Tax=Neptuniibacter caesariensis TaxID=207954 RepID=A0A7U8GTH7_NEPCE|nr:tetratricopeptide repeat protein [Neptuniibacter caesariensis]EAR62155.1 hypothetical protein MED92_10629 [Oceanospirillum sp. MED92] [Neptuniibacter caesariensis]